MDASVWIQISVTAGGIFASLFGVLKYISAQNTKREKEMFEFFENLQKQQIEYYTTKNGHMERIAKDFTKASNKMSMSIGKLATEIKVLSSKK